MRKFVVNLHPGEEVLLIGKVSWWELTLGVILTSAGLVFQFPLLIAIGLICFIGFQIYRKTTKIVITTDKIVYKQGWLSWKIQEIYYRQMESVEVKQNLIGMMFNFGNVIVKGTGGTLVTLFEVEKPNEINQAILNQISGYYGMAQVII